MGRYKLRCRAHAPRLPHELAENGEVVMSVSGLDGRLEELVERIRHSMTDPALLAQLEQGSKRHVVYIDGRERRLVAGKATIFDSFHGINHPPGPPKAFITMAFMLRSPVRRVEGAKAPDRAARPDPWGCGSATSSNRAARLASSTRLKRVSYCLNAFAIRSCVCSGVRSSMWLAIDQ